jgi:hypothetical protein
MNKFTVALMLCISLVSTTAFAWDSSDSYLITSLGIGVPYGGTVGLNNEFILNEYCSGQLGIGYTDHVNVGIVGGITGYPLKNNQYRISPRLTALYGKVGRVHYSDGNYKKGYGYALGGGVEYPITADKKWRTGLDLFYAKITNPEKSSGDVVVSLGFGYSFQ